MISDNLIFHPLHIYSMSGEHRDKMHSILGRFADTKASHPGKYLLRAILVLSFQSPRPIAMSHHDPILYKKNHIRSRK